MPIVVNLSEPTLVPLLRYRDVAAAIDWLGAAFRFERASFVTADDGAILYAQVTCGNAIIMLEPAPDGAMQEASPPAGAEAQSCYLVVDDADAHYARARRAGAEIVLEIENFGQGGRVYACRDPEGHVWSFGTYDPWQGRQRVPAMTEPPSKQPEESAALPTPPENGARAKVRWAIVSGLLASVLTSAVAAAWISGTEQRAPREVTASLAATQPSDDLIRERHAREAAERAVEDARSAAATERAAMEKNAKEATDRRVREAAAILATERAARAAAEKAVSELRSKLEQERQQSRASAEKAAAAPSHANPAQARAAGDAASSAAGELKAQLAKEAAAREAAENAKAEAEAELDRARRAAEDSGRVTDRLKEQLATAQSAKEAAERAVREARDQASRERSAKDQAWRTVAQLRKQLARAQTGDMPSDGAAPSATAAPSAKSDAPAKADPQYNGPMSPF